MRLQISTDYAVRILLYLHENRHEAEPHTAMNISRATRMTYPFFIKIVKLLRKKELVKTVQGRNGGHKLGRPAHEISFYDVFLATEGELQINRCFKPEDEPCTNGRKEDCEVHKFLRHIQENVLVKSMQEKMISELAYSAEGESEKELILQERIAALELENGLLKLRDRHNQRLYLTPVASCDSAEQTA